MKTKIYTIVLTLLGSSVLFAQQWTGTNTTSSDISRTGKVSVGNTYTNANLNVQDKLAIYGGVDNSSLDFYTNGSKFFAPTLLHSITPVYLSQPIPNSTLSYAVNALSIGSVADKTFVMSHNKIGMGTYSVYCADCDSYRLFVKDGIRTEKIKVDIAASNNWADYVFEENYKLMPLQELEQFIKNNGHLPEVPTTQEAIENGIELKEMNILLLKKVEELTLYTIELQKRIEILEKNK